MIPKDKINRKGRKPGSKNLVTRNVREQFKLLVDSNIIQLQTDLDSLEPKDRVNAIINIAKFILPTLKAVEITPESRNMFKPIQLNFDSNETD